MFALFIITFLCNRPGSESFPACRNRLCAVGKGHYVPWGPTLCFNQLLCVNIFKTIGPLCTCHHLKGNLETEHTVPNPMERVQFSAFDHKCKKCKRLLHVKKDTKKEVSKDLKKTTASGNKVMVNIMEMTQTKGKVLG